VYPYAVSGSNELIFHRAHPKADFMEAKNKFSLLRKLLGAIGLSPEAMDDIIEHITDFLSDKGDKAVDASIDYTYRAIIYL
jgi:hypothetical protein